MRATILTGTLLATFAASVAAQDDRHARVREVFTAEALSRIEQIVTEARAAGLPADPLMDKALEGAAKGVPADRVVAALSAYSDRLGRAGNVLGEGRSAGELVAAADAMRRGVPDMMVGELARDHSGDLAIPLVVLGDLMDAGVPVAGAYTVVKAALQRGSPPDEMLAIPGAVRRLIREGQLPGQAAAAIGRIFSDGPPGPPGRLIGPPSGPPVPPGAGPPEGAGPPKDRPRPPIDPPGGQF